MARVPDLFADCQEAPRHVCFVSFPHSSSGAPSVGAVVPPEPRRAFALPPQAVLPTAPLLPLPRCCRPETTPLPSCPPQSALLLLVPRDVAEWRPQSSLQLPAAVLRGTGVPRKRWRCPCCWLGAALRLPRTRRRDQRTRQLHFLPPCCRLRGWNHRSRYHCWLNSRSALGIKGSNPQSSNIVPAKSEAMQLGNMSGRELLLINYR